jgi:hypothetical protein
VEDWKDTKHPRLHGQALALKPYETSRSLAIAPDGHSFLLGADWSLRCFDRHGRPRWQTPVPGIAWAVNISGDGRLGLAAFGDGTVRWYRMRDGQELLALFLPRDGRRWVAWTPSGDYLAAPGGEDLIGWQLNRGLDAAPDFFPVGRLRARFYRPEVVEQVLTTLDEDAAVREAGGRPALNLAAALPPVVELLSPRDGDGFPSAQVRLRYRVRSPAPVRDLQVQVDGRPLPTVRGLSRERPTSDGEQTLTVTLPERDLALSLIAESANGASTPATAHLHWQGRTPLEARTAIAFVIKPKLYLLAVGVGDYRSPQVNKLRYPAKDAQDLAAAFQAQQGGLYRGVVARVLPEADRAQVADGLDWLQGQVTQHDVAVLFLAGHGLDGPNHEYYFLARDSDPAHLRATGVSQAMIRDTLNSLPGKVLAFIDTCHAGDLVGGAGPWTWTPW